jgi:hypothetical protein
MSSFSDRELRYDRDSSVLVDSIQLMEAPKRIGTFGFAIRSIVWLNRFDIGDNFVGQTIDFSLELSPLFSVEGLSEHREFTGLRIAPSPMMDQGPDSLIECSSQTLKSIPKDQKNIDMGLLKLDLVSNPIQFQFLLGDDSVGIFTEGRDFLSQVI